MTVPQHVAIIMDGNGRWAKERGMARVQGHNAGMKALREIVKHSDVLGVKYLTVYAFSTENWKRPEDEVSGIFKLLVRYVKSEIRELDENNVRVRILGDWSVIPEDSRKAVQTALARTEDNTGLVFSIALNYGGRAEILRAARAAAEKVLSGEIGVGDIDESIFSEGLYTYGMPDPDVIIRTGGEYRLSNFLTWQSAYSELVVTPVYWPDFTPEEYDRALEEFSSRDRRFGGIK
ncbi:MAG: isoprenyl transferase [Firmicutes bacterium]|nr:isoprenyl transferase [Bacillota bacterium]MBR6352265.1 isoprenyl transferase [Bacillota bacterium]